MITAKEARELSEDAPIRNREEKLKELGLQIGKATLEGYFSITIYEQLEYDIIEKLQENGYKVVTDSDKFNNFLSIEVSW